MAKNLSTDIHEHDEAADAELYELLKTGAEAPGDADESTVGTNPDQYEPPVRESGTLDAPWGEKPPTDQVDALHYSDAFLKSFKEGREKMLETLFDSASSSNPAEQKFLSQHFDHAARGEFQTSSPQVSEKAKLMTTNKTSSARPETLTQQVNRLIRQG